jgi:Ser/Thr protein kinase RdoA (MazF antagonist)
MHRALKHYCWIRELVPHAVPALIDKSEQYNTLSFESLRPAEHIDATSLLNATAVLAEFHAAAIERTSGGMPKGSLLDFESPRRKPLLEAFGSRNTNSPIRIDDLDRVFELAASGPSCVYKDANFRNMLNSKGRIYFVDFDDLTKAPIGYDLAKLWMTLKMSDPLLPNQTLLSCLATYNHRLSVKTNLEELSVWLELNWLLTQRYVGTNYLNRWPDLRPNEVAKAFVRWQNRRN